MFVALANHHDNFDAWKSTIRGIQRPMGLTAMSSAVGSRSA